MCVCVYVCVVWIYILTTSDYLLSTHVWKEGMAMVELNMDLYPRLVATPTNFVANTSIADLHRKGGG